MSILSNDIPALGETNPEETYDLLKEDEKDQEVIEEEKPKEEEEKEEEVKPDEGEGEEEKEEIDELKELEDELNEPDEEDLEIVTPVRRAEILRKYPKIFKDFPYLEKAYYRERKYSEIFPSPSDAQAAFDKAETLTNFEQELLGGDLTRVLESVKKENKESFNQISDNYLKALANVDRNAYDNVIGNIIRITIHNMIEEAGNQDENTGKLLKNTAQILNQFVFGTSKFTNPQKMASDSPEKSDREKQIEERETKYREQQFENAKTGLEDRIETILKSNITKYIDPKSSMTPYIKRTAEKDALETVYNLMAKDTRFGALRDKLWQFAEKNDFNAESIGRIRTAYLSKVQTLLPTVIKKARNEALKGMGKRVIEDKPEEETEERQPQSRKSSASEKSGQRTKRGEIPAGMSSKDFIMSD